MIKTGTVAVGIGRVSYGSASLRLRYIAFRVTILCSISLLNELNHSSVFLFLIQQMSIEPSGQDSALPLSLG